MTYNIKYDNPSDTTNSWTKRRITMMDMIRYYQPDVLGIQEGLSHQVNYIDSSLTNYWYYGMGRDDGATKGEYCAIYYNHHQLSLLDSGTFWLSPTPREISKGWDAALERICTYGKFSHRTTGKEFWVFNTHFDHRGVQAREHSASLVVNKINELNPEALPVVLMGDFNATPSEKPITIIIEALNQASQISAKPLYGPYGTYNGFTNDLPDRLIDYIFVKGVHVKEYRHIDDRLPTALQISDHYPVLMRGSIDSDK